MYVLMGGQQLSNTVIRQSLPTLILFMGLEFGFADVRKSALLGAFFPGYLMTQLPAGWAAQRYGPKIIFTLNLLGHTLCLALPAAAAASNPMWLYTCLTALGLAQGPLIPVQGALKTNWLTKGPSRAWALRVIGLGNRLAGPLANWLVPSLAATRFGWRSVAYLWGTFSGVFAVVWHCLAADAPAEETSKAAAFADVTSSEQKTVRWDIFKLPSTLVVPWCHLCDNNAMYSLAMLAPTVYTTRLGLLPEHLGPHLAIPPAINVFGAFVIAALENSLSARGHSLATVQKLFTGFGAVLEFVFLTAFAVAKRPMQATVAYCCVVVGHLLHGSGFYTNFQDVGGKDSAILWAVSNPLANIPGLVAPILSTFWTRRLGSFQFPLFFTAALMQLSAGVLFVRFASATPARDTIDTREHFPRRKIN